MTKQKIIDTKFDRFNTIILYILLIICIPTILSSMAWIICQEIGCDKNNITGHIAIYGVFSVLGWVAFVMFSGIMYIIILLILECKNIGNNHIMDDKNGT